jgi:MtN3 and saliva related transmembrane protein
MHFTVWTIIGIIAALLTSFSFVPQVRKMWRRRSAKDVSHVTMFQLMAGCALWLVYGISRQDPVIIGANVVAIGTLLVGLSLYYRYNGRGN